MRTKIDSDPVHEDGGAWWFWDEVWCGRYGPYASEDEARESLRRYCAMLNAPGG